MNVNGPIKRHNNKIRKFAFDSLRLENHDVDLNNINTAITLESGESF